MVLGVRIITVAGLLLAAVLPASAGTAQSAWTEGHNSRVRLVAATLKAADGRETLTAGIEIGLDNGWKTYWRNPGDNGGVPPEFDFKKSVNAGSPKVMFPAPSRLADPLGDSIGYKHGVLFPVALTPADPAKPVILTVTATYGVCAKVCIPEEHELTLTIDPTAPLDEALASLVSKALARIPSANSGNQAAPQLAGVKLDTAGGKPSVIIDTLFPSGASDTQVFAEALDSSYVPQPDRMADSGDGHQRFRIDCTKSDDFKQPSGKQLRLTLVGAESATEATITIP